MASQWIYGKCAPGIVFKCLWSSSILKLLLDADSYFGIWCSL